MALAANAGSDRTVYAGEPILLDGSLSTDYSDVSQANGTWSIRWTFGDGLDAENIIKAPHCYLEPGVYTASLQVKSAAGSMSVADTAQITVQAIPEGTVHTFTDQGSAAANKTALQNWLNTNASNTGNLTLKIPAGVEIDGGWELPARTGPGYHTIQVTDLTGLDALTRAGMGDKAKFFLVHARNANGHYHVIVNKGAHNYRVIGMEVRRTEGTTESSDMVCSIPDWPTWTEQPSNIIFDRCLIDGNNFPVNRGWAPNGKYFSLINSSIVNIKQVGGESKAIGLWRGEGPLAVINCHLEGSGINFMTGGDNVQTETEIPKGIVFRGNYVYKDPAWLGNGYGIKNLWEMKTGHWVTCIGNVMVNNYIEGQSGHAILLKSSTQTDTGSAPYNSVSHVDFRYNKILNVAAPFNVVGLQALATGLPYPEYLNHVFFKHNLWTGTGQNHALFQGANQFEVIHNTFIGTTGMVRFEHGAEGMPSDYKAPGAKILGNVADHYEGGFWVYSGSDGNGYVALAAYLDTDQVVGDSLAASDANSTWHPAEIIQTWVAFRAGFVNYAGGNYRLASGSPGKNAAPDGIDCGADIDALESNTASAVSGVWGDTTPPPADTTPPSTITNLTAVATGTTSVDLNCDAPTDDVGVTGFVVERAEDGGFSVNLVSEQVNSAARPFAVAGLMAGTTYHFRVKAKDAAGNESAAWSNTASATTTASGDTTPPTVPILNSATALGSTGATLQWTTSTDNVGVTGYEVQVNAGAWVNYGNKLTVQVTGLTPGQTYTFKVRAFDAAGNRSAESNEVELTLPTDSMDTNNDGYVTTAIEWGTGSRTF